MKKTIVIKLSWLAILLLLVTLSSATGAVADDSIFTPESKLTTGDYATAEDQFGFSMAVDGDTMVVGAPYNDAETCTNPPRCNTGAVYLFKSAGNTWVPDDTTFELTASDAVNGDQFGWSVAIDGDRLAVGAPSKNEGKAVSGAVYLFEYDGNTWVPDENQQKLTASVPESSGRFGFSLALDGDKLVVGAPGSGSVFVFERQSDGKWLPVVTPELPVASMFGLAVAARHGRVVVGAPGSGLAYVLEGDSWIELPAKTPFLGCALALHGDTVVVGAPSSMHPFVSAEGSGRVYLFKLQGTTWVEEDVLELPYAWGFGSSVSFDGNVLVVGAPFDEVHHPAIPPPEPPDEPTLIKAGSAYVFGYENEEWVMKTQLIAGDPDDPDNDKAEPMMNDRFGWTVVTSDNTVVAGATFINAGGLPSNAGAAYAFVLTSSDNNAPTANAIFRPDDVIEGDMVTLDGSLSSDPDNDPLTYEWVQRVIDHEPQVELDLTNPETPIFLAPELNPECTTFTFDLTVTDDKGSSSKPYTLEVPVQPNNEIHSTLGRKKRRGKRRWWRPRSFLHRYKFRGKKGENVTISMKADPNGWHRGSRASLFLKDCIWGVHFLKRGKKKVPNQITATLPADGEYSVYVIKRPRWFCRWGKSFTGDYVLTAKGTCGKLLK